MARYDVHPHPSGRGYLLDVQSDLLDQLNTRIMVPLMTVDTAPVPSRRLNPTFEIRSAPYIMVTQYMSAVPRSELRAPVTSLAHRDSQIADALDMLFLGF